MSIPLEVSMREHLSRLVFTLALLIAICLPSAALGQGASALGKISFETSGSSASQTHFLRGVAALHSFWFEEALDEFRQSTKADPNFMMGYWGESMALNHPLWSEQDTEAAKQVIKKIRDDVKVTDRERAYLNAVKALYGEGDKLARDMAYCAAMEKIYSNYPDDLEAAAFYALSLLGAVRPGDKGYRAQALAGAIALDVYARNPDHPGAAHYIIHAFDDPEHAILALPAARRYAQIAPDAHHARHMPAHIFLQLGMWPEAAASNESAWTVSDEWVKRKHLSLSARDYHSLHWLMYVYLQQGRVSAARQLLATMQKTMAESKDEDRLRPNYYANNYATMAATLIVETEQWELASSLFGAYSNDALEGGSKDLVKDPMMGEHAGHGPTAAATTPRRSDAGNALPVFVRSLAGLAKNSADIAIASAGEGASPARRIYALELTAVAAAVHGRMNEAIDSMKKACGIEENMSPPSGPPTLIKPSHELYGEILLRAQRTKEAAEQFRHCLLRQPNRARSLLGLARAEAQAGNREEARSIYSKLLKQWQQADDNLVEIKEARGYLSK